MGGRGRGREDIKDRGDVEKEVDGEGGETVESYAGLSCLIKGVREGEDGDAV